MSDDVHGVAADQLRSIVERIERMHEEKKAISDDIKEIYAEAKSNGYDAKAIREIVRIRGKETAELQQFESILDLYKSALGMPLSHAHAHEVAE